MMSILLALIMAVTPAECKKDPEWCECRRYIAKELNQCEVKAKTDAQLRLCMKRYEAGKIACKENDGDVYDFAIGEIYRAE